MDFGAFVAIAKGTEGLLHISEIEWKRLDKVPYNEGDMVEVKFMGYDDRKKMKLSRKVLLERPPREERPQGDRPQYNNDRPREDRPQGDRPQRRDDRPQHGNDRPQHNNDRGNDRQENREDRPQNDGPQNEDNQN
jgi:polyribonucleotide nucleotidyltransferase